MATDTRPGYEPGDPAYRRVTAALFLAGVATFATIYCTQPLLAVLAAEFRVSPATATLSVSVTTISLGVALLFAGPLSDAVGRTRLMIASLAASGLACLACAFVTDWAHMLLLRGAVGVLVAGLPAVATAYLREEIHHHWASAATGLYIGGTAIGGMAGRLITGFLATRFDWRTAVAGIGVLGLAVAAAVALILPRSRHFHASALHHRALRANARRMLLDRGLLTLYAIGFCSMGAFVATFNALSFRLAAPPFSLTPATMSLLFLTYAVGSFASTWAGRLATRRGSRAVVPWALAVEGAGIALTLSDALAAVVVGVAVLSVGFFAAHGVTSAWVTARASRKGPGTGQAGALYLFGYYLGSSAIGALAGVAWSAAGWPAVVALAGGTVACGVLLAWSMRGVPIVSKVIDPQPPQH